jgi:glycine/D-amino acid oxidase-like deaminating enzyme
MASTQVWDAIIVGQGLAGTTLAWHLHAAGQRVLLLDAEPQVTSSKIAAGLMTPITGQRLALSWRVGEFLPFARDFYHLVEQITGGSFFFDRTAVRLLQTDAERQHWSRRMSNPAIRSHLIEKASHAEPTFGGSAERFEMHAAQLDVAAFLAASRTALPYERMDLDWRRDVAFSTEKVAVNGHEAKYLISCEGYAAIQNPYFAEIRFIAAKGDILTVRFAELLPSKCYHGGIWVAPTSDPYVFRVGASYDWKILDCVPSAPGRAELERKLAALIAIPFTVIEHRAAVRPIIHLSKPLLGMHPRYPRLGYFNGLGSKGSLHAPWFARSFAEYLVQGTPLEEPDALAKALF